MTTKRKLTAVDRDALEAMPDGWFCAEDLPYPRVTRAVYRCDRLRDLGYLEWRVVGAHPHLRSEYRLIKNTDVEA